MANDILATANSPAQAATTQPVTPAVPAATSSPGASPAAPPGVTVTLSYQATQMTQSSFSVSYATDSYLAPERESIDKPAPSLLGQLKEAFLSFSSASNFNARVDFNGDGRINFSDMAALKAGLQSTPVDTGPVADDPVADDPAEPVTLQTIRDAFLSVEGDDTFNIAADLTGDGRVNFADLAALRASEATPAVDDGPVIDEPAQPATLQTVRDAFLSSDGDDNFNAAADLNGDGRINFADLAALRASQATPAVDDGPISDEPAGPATLQTVRDAFLSSEGDESFNVAADLTGDGRINFADLAALRASELSPPSQVADNQGLLTDIRQAFLERTGSSGFRLSADLNADGIVNFGDLAALRARISSSDALNESLVGQLDSLSTEDALRNRIDRLEASYGATGDAFLEFAGRFDDSSDS